MFLNLVVRGKRSLISYGLQIRTILDFQRICQKIIFSQLLDQDLSLMKEEINFIMKLIDIKPLTTIMLVKSLIKETTNNKITDYF